MQKYSKKDKNLKLFYSKKEIDLHLLKCLFSLLSCIKGRSANFIKSFLVKKHLNLGRKISKTKFFSRCLISNRGRSTLRNLKTSRIVLRNLLTLGKIPGYKKSVW